MFKKFSELREKSIPNQDVLRAKKAGFRQFSIDVNNSLYNDPVDEIRKYGLKGENYYFKEDNPPYYESIQGSIPELLLRSKVIEKCIRINASLEEVGLELFFNDCFRPVEVQNYFHDVWFPAQLRMRHPDWNESKILQETENFWSRGAPSSDDIDPLSPPPHSTGAAFDVLIRKTKNQEPLFFGSLTEDVTEIAYPDYYEKESSIRQLNFSEIEAMQNRRLLYWIMKEEEFIINPTEWWHFSWGDQMWAKLTDQESAIYSNITVHSALTII